jgi:hypothetical protein
MGINKQPIFTGTPILTCGSESAGNFSSFNPTNVTNTSISIFTATATEGTLIERITISPMGTYNTSYNNISEKVVFLIVRDDSESQASILKTKKWSSVDLNSQFIELPYWEITFQGGLLLENGDSILINQVLNDGQPPAGDGDGLMWIVEGSTYTAQ